MHRFIFALTASTALVVSGPAYAQRGHGPATSPTVHGQSTTHGSSGATTHGSSGATTHGNSGTTTHGQSGSHGPATKPTTSTTTHGSGNTHASGGGNPHSTGGTSTTTKSGGTATGTSPTTTTGTGSTVTLTPVQQKLQKNTNLADKLRTRLPANTDLMDAAKGFKNLGQFVAAVNVSNNLGLDFTQLKTRMVDDGMSLGQAIQTEKKTVDVETEVHRAETQADTMINSSTTTAAPQPFPTPTTTTKAKKTSGKQ
jgi:hypothetical protein